MLPLTIMFPLQCFKCEKRCARIRNNAENCGPIASQKCARTLVDPNFDENVSQRFVSGVFVGDSHSSPCQIEWVSKCLRCHTCQWSSQKSSYVGAFISIDPKQFTPLLVRCELDGRVWDYSGHCGWITSPQSDKPLFDVRISQKFHGIPQRIWNILAANGTNENYLFVNLRGIADIFTEFENWFWLDREVRYMIWQFHRP